MLPLIRFFFLTKTIWATLAAFLAGTVVILLVGGDPIAAYWALFHGAFFDYYGLGSTLIKASPILLAGFAVIIPMRAGLLNVGAEGQIYMGGLFASAIALYMPEACPAFILFCLCVVGGALGGGLWAAISGYLKAYRNLNEVISSLLLNYVAINLVSFAAGGPMMQEGAPYPYSREIRDDLWMSQILPGTDAHSGVIAALLLAVVFYLVVRFSTIGFTLNMVGKNPHAAAYAGINVRSSIMVAMFTGGAVAGLAGAFEVLGLKYRLYHLFSPGYGYDGIVAAFLADLHPMFLPLASLFLGGLKAGGQQMQRSVGLDSTIIDLITGLVIIFVAASLAFHYDRDRWRQFLGRRRKTNDSLKNKDED